MDKLTALKKFQKWDRLGRFIFTKKQLHQLFPLESASTLARSIERLVEQGILKRPVKGVYVYNFTNNNDGYTLERIALAMREGMYSYLSLESALSEYGLISQMLIDRITVMTTGRKGEHKTPYGVIEFTHTARSIASIIPELITIEGRPMRIASKEMSLRDFRRVGRNQNMLVEDV